MQCEQKEKNRNAAEQLDQDVNVVKVFMDFHTSSKNSLSDAARATVVSTFFCFP
jgi:hypothetical protein